MGSAISARPLTSPLVPPPQVVGLAEAARLLGVDRDTVLRYARFESFPEARRLASGPVWHRSEVERWGEKNLPLPRGPKPKKGNRK
jgi:predicted DNA-binding transcriptional regulator AlpA